MSTEYERTTHSGKSTEGIPLSEQEARSSYSENDMRAGESEADRADESGTHHTGATHEGERADAADVDVEPEHVSTTEYGAQSEHDSRHEDATATEYGTEHVHATTDHDAKSRYGTPDYEAQPTDTNTADYDYDAQPTSTADTQGDRATVAADAESDRGTAADTDLPADTTTGQTTATDTTSDQASTSGNDAERQQVSLDEVGAPVFADTDLDRLRTQWREVQGAFVDNPREAVTQADKIVADLIYQLTTTYAERKRVLEERCAGVGDADTEDLRQALRGYRGFFHRLLAVEQ
ncbi:hypothetical protein DFR70_118128 [Nocardia tenerifensis]|uniref:Uncharacterized protein n=1 Tax=Nocardia tenerifensis TaxID=228006 RepID=A0A318KDT8_9NOCA|nr:hypothetical protein [Nocardia tenerifensis]PXX57473.1 hypothetical protein DFR70_118128 [Nocardia tenerifensis]